jgi:hypothetical protein
LGAADELITDTGADLPQLEELRSAGLKVTVV